MPITTYNISPSFSFNGHPFLVCKDLLAQDIIYKLVEPVSIGTIGEFETFVKNSLGESDFSLKSMLDNSEIAKSFGIGKAITALTDKLDSVQVILKEFEINTTNKTKSMTILFALPNPIDYLSLSLSGITFTITSEADGTIQSVDDKKQTLVIKLSQKSEWATSGDGKNCQLTIFTNEGEIKVNGSSTINKTTTTATITLDKPVDLPNEAQGLVVNITPAKQN